MIKALRNGVIAYVITALVGLPFVAELAYADSIATSSASGRAFGDEIKSGVAVDFDETTGLVTSQGQEIIVYPQTGGSVSDIRNTYGDSAALQAAVAAQSSTLKTENTDAGNAYRTLMGGVNVPRPELRNDVILSNSEAVLKDTAASGQFGQCYSTITTVETPGESARFEDIRTCERFVKPTGCQVTRVLSTAKPVQLVSGQGAGRQISASQYEMTIGREGSDYLIGQGCTIHQSTVQFRVLEPQQIKKATLTFLKWDDYFQMQIDGTEIFTVPQAPFPNGTTACDLNTNWTSYPDLDVTQHLKSVPAGGIIGFTLNVAVSDQGEGYAKIILELEEPEQEIVQNPPGCLDLIISNPERLGDPDPSWSAGGSLNNQASSAYWACTSASNAYAITHDGGEAYTVTPDDFWFLGPLFPGEPGPPAPMCFQAQQRTLGLYDSCSDPDAEDDPDDPQAECQTVDWSDKPDEYSNCQALQANSNCRYLESQCTETTDGACSAYEDFYDCGSSTSTGTTTSTQETLVCPGNISCMGTECSAPVAAERNSDLSKVVPYMEIMKNSPQDTQCDQSGGGCTFLGGQAYTCKKIIGGLQDCCDQPTPGVSAVDYIKLGYHAYDLAQDSGLMETLAPMGAGLWKNVSSPVGSLYDEISKPLISAYDSVVGSSVAGAGAVASGAEGASIIDGASSMSGLGLGSIKQMITNQVVDWARSVFGEQIAGQGTSLFIQNGGNWVLNVTGNMGAAFISYVMWVYAVYQMIKILVNLLWPCSKAEFQLAAKKEQRLCHYVGKKDKKVLGVKVSTKKKYCCFSTAFARILHEQTRNGSQPGLSKPWGGYKHADCSGFTQSQFEAINFSTVNLSEWLALLKLADVKVGADAAKQLAADLAGSRTLPDGKMSAPSVQRTKALINQTTGGSQDALDNRREELQQKARTDAISRQAP